MALLGIDIGDQSCFVGTILCGGIEILTNDVTDRSTPAIVSFRDKDRQMGSSAKSQIIGNYENTIFGIKNLLGRDYNDPIVQHEVRRLPYFVGQYPNSTQVGIKICFLGVETWFTPTQIYSMLLRHIVDNAERTLNSKILSAVISVPSHFTDIQRRAVLDAGILAGVDLKRLMNDGNALALAYGIYKNDLPEDGQPPRIVAFVDFGHTSFQINIFAFSIGKAVCLSCVSYPNLGGRDFDERLFNFFSTQFNEKYKVNILETKKSCLKLLSECEKLKKLLSANITSIPMNIECLLGDIDFTSRMNRTEFEELCGDLFIRIRVALQEALLLSKIDLRDLFSVELVGGSCRIPEIARLVQSVFFKEVNKTLNFDETVAKGCAIQSVLLSPTLYARQFHVVGVIPYSINISWIDVETGMSGEMNAFMECSSSNLSKVFSFYRKSDFQIKCNYKNADSNLHHDPFIAAFTIQNVQPTDDGQVSKVKVKLRVDNSGILTIPDVECIFEVSNVISDKVIPVKQVAHAPYLTDDKESVEIKLTTGSHIEAINTARDPENTLSKNVSEDIRSIVLPIITDARNMSPADLDKAIEIEQKLVSHDRYHADKANSKNALEEYVYDMRDKLNTFLSDYFTEVEKYQFKEDLERLHDWLLNDDTQEEPSVYKEHLYALRQKGDQANIRHMEFQERPIALNKLVKSINRLRYFLSEFKNGNAEYQNLDADEIAKLEKVVDERQSWLEEQLETPHQSVKFINPKVTAAEVFAMENILENIFASITSSRKSNSNEKLFK